MIKQQLDEPVPGTYPQAFIDRYPELAGLVNRAAPEFSLSPTPRASTRQSRT